MILHEVTGFLGERRRADVLRLLNSPDLEWERPDRLGRTTSGRMWQLANSDMHYRPEMIQLSTLMASVVYNEIQRARPRLLPDPGEAIPQVFPVRMEGNTDEPPTQWAHKDEARGQHPCVTALYYAEVENVIGGALALHHPSGDVHTSVEPVTDQLVVIAGDQTHSVEPLTAGNRITVVTNYYKAADRVGIEDLEDG